MGAKKAIGKDLLDLGLSVGTDVLTKKKSLKSAIKDAVKKEGLKLAKKGATAAMLASQQGAGRTRKGN